jgi:Fe-S-cluster-containing hydrogenase component 2
MRCTSCKSCTIACPFGIIFQDFIPYLDSKCDYCVGITEGTPKCITSCPHKGAIEIKDVEEDLTKDIYFVGEHLAVHTAKWIREDIPKRNETFKSQI